MDFLETGTIRKFSKFPHHYSRSSRKTHLVLDCALLTATNLEHLAGDNHIFRLERSEHFAANKHLTRRLIALYCGRFHADQPEDAEALQAELAATCNFIISLRFPGMVFNDELGEPGTYFYVSWAQ